MTTTMTFDEKCVLITDLKLLKRHFINNVLSGVVQLSPRDYLMFKGRLDAEIESLSKTL